MDLVTLGALSKNALFSKLKTGAKGLTSREVAVRLKTYGPNQVDRETLSWWRLLVKQFASPFVYLLGASAVLSFIFHDQISGWMIVAFVVLNALLGFFQEYHAEKAVAMLQAILRPTCTVFRNGKEERVPCIELVPGDICLVEVGDIIPADGVIIETEACLCDESVLTGESFPSTKQEAELLRAGTKVTQGWAKFCVVNTGRTTSLGTIAKLTSETAAEGSYQKSIRRLSVAILWFVVIAVAVTFVLRLVFQGDSTLTWIQFAIFSVALAVSVVPETLPLVVTICLSRGALLMAKKQVVVKRLSSIEDLGSIEILCTDKTGTLTENRLRVGEIREYTGNARILALQCVEAARLKNPADLDPFSRALIQGLSKEDQRILAASSLKAHLPFDPRRKRVTAFVMGREGGQVISCGAAEEVLKLCTHVPTSFRTWVLEQGKEGRRVLAVATRTHSGRKVGADLEREERAMTLSGGISFEDPLKATACSALQQIHALGVKVKMLTGDSPEVAAAIAKRVGLIKDASEVLTGEAFLKLSAAARLKSVKTCAVFARVDPKQKYIIIQELQRHGSVGFMGEGINDAPALKLANVGIAVKEASDIAREAADIILLDKGLDVIAQGMTTGRHVFVNIGKYIRATLISNFGNFFAVVVSLFFIPTLPMLPIQILLLNLLSDFPMTAICFDRVTEGEARMPVKFSIRPLLFFCLTLGVVSTVFDFLFFAIYQSIAPTHLQVMWFLASVFTELLLIFSIRSSKWFFQAVRPPLALWGATVLAAAAALFVTFVSPFAEWFSFPRPTASLLTITAGLVILYFLLTDVVKHLYLRWTSSRSQNVHPGPSTPLYLVTGGAGFIGSHVVDGLIEAGYAVRVFDNLYNGKREQVHPEAELIMGDVMDYEALERAMVGVDGVFHLAALPRVAYSVEFPHTSAHVNLDGTLHVLEAARKNGVKRVVFSSTSAIYGNSTREKQSPSDPVDLLNPYALHKYMGEELAIQYQRLYGLQTVCLRYFNVYGPRMDDEGGYGSVIAIFRKQRSQGKPLTIEGDGSQGRDFVFVSDVARANVLAMRSDRVGAGEILNVGTGSTTTVKEIARIFGGKQRRKPARSNDVAHTRADIAQTTTLLGWKPEVSFEEGLKQLL